MPLRTALQHWTSAMHKDYFIKGTLNLQDSILVLTKLRNKAIYIVKIISLHAFSFTMLLLILSFPLCAYNHLLF